MSGMKKEKKKQVVKKLPMSTAEIFKYLEENKSAMGSFTFFYFDAVDGSLNVVGSTERDETCAVAVAAGINAQKAMLGSL